MVTGTTHSSIGARHHLADIALLYKALGQEVTQFSSLGSLFIDASGGSAIVFQIFNRRHLPAVFIRSNVVPELLTLVQRSRTELNLTVSSRYRLRCIRSRPHRKLFGSIVYNGKRLGSKEANLDHFTETWIISLRGVCKFGLCGFSLYSNGMPVIVLMFGWPEQAGVVVIAFLVEIVNK